MFSVVQNSLTCPGFEQAHDWEAYQELLREQMGPETTTERYEVISRFLNDTEEYLHKLASKVASVRLSQEASEAAAIAVAEARARVRRTPVPFRCKIAVNVSPSAPRGLRSPSCG
jgi:hypothetical protein